MTDQIINRLNAELYGAVPSETLKTVSRKLTIILADYDVVQKSTDMVPYTGCIPQAYKDFMVTLKLEGRSMKTLALYKLRLEKLFETLQTPVREITGTMLKSYLYRYQDEHDVKTSTMNGMRAAFKSFFSWAAAEGYIDKDPMANIKPFKTEQKEPDTLTDIELAKVRLACRTPREKALIEFLYSTAARVEEVSRMNISDVNFDALEVSLFGKGSKHRTSYLTANCMILLKEYLDSRADQCEALFVYDKAPHSRFQKAGIEALLKKIGARAGVPRLHPHLFRHTACTNALRHGMELAQAQEYLGHASANTTKLYAKIAKADVKAAHQKFIA